MIPQQTAIAILDNSVSFTGAFKCALTEARLLQDDYRFVFIVPTGSSNVSLLKEEGIAVYELPFVEIGRSIVKLLRYWPMLFKNSLQLKKILSKENVSVLQANDFYNLAGVGAKWSGYKGKLVTYVRLLPSAVPAPLRRLWVASAYKYADAVIAVSKAVSKELPEHSKKTCVYDALVLPEKWPPVTYNQRNSPVIFLYLANYIRGKGQEHALAAFKKAWCQNKNIQLWFAGGDMGLEKNHLFKSELQAEVQRLGLTEVIFFLPFQTDIEALIKKSDVVLNFSEAESFSMTVAEAGYYGRPVIATRCGGPEELILNGETGLLVDKGNIADMMQAMVKLATNATLRKNLGQAACISIRERFSAEAFKESFKTVLAKCSL